MYMQKYILSTASIRNADLESLCVSVKMFFLFFKYLKNENHVIFICFLTTFIGILFLVHLTFSFKKKNIYFTFVM